MPQDERPGDPAEWQRAAHYYDRIAARYEEHLAGPTNTRVRAQLLAQVAGAVAPGSCILDFGCGTGLDAAWLAEQGHRVVAYDVSGEMLTQLETRCAGAIAAGRVVPWRVDYATFLGELPQHHRPDAVISDFCALNHVSDLAPLFAALARALPPGGQVFAVVLNPFYLGDMAHRWWWSALRRGIRHRWVHFRGDGLDTFRHFPSAIEAAARPHFAPNPNAPVNPAVRALRPFHQFLFLSWRRRQGDAPAHNSAG
jgi:SAM-dependent methyltransferase